jgi:beta-glucosidase
MALPEEDTQLVRRVAAACRRHGKRSLVILNVCAPVEIADWVDEVDAVLLAWMAGMEIGHAVADVVSGDVCPSGKLPLTWPRQYRDAPTAPFFPGEFAETVYGEDILVGYRYYDTAGVAPLYEFGFGLSYTSFELGNLRLGAETLNVDAGETMNVDVDVSNTGPCKGREVVQLYIHDVRSSVRKAAKELKGFRKIELAPGEKKTVRFMLGGDDLAHFDSRRGRWCVEPGLFEIQAGTSSRDIRLRARFRATGYNPYAYGMHTPICRILADRHARAVLEKYLPAGALADRELAELAACLPYTPLNLAWHKHFSVLLEDRGADEVAAIHDRIAAELAAIEPD